MLAAFEELLAGTRELQLLRIMGLFDRPARFDLIEAVLDSEPIDGLTSNFTADYRAELPAAVERLRELGLLSPASSHRPDEVDCHPMIREHFAAQLESQLPDGARQAHGRLFEHLCGSVEDQPDTLDRLQPLYQAVAHGCLAGRQQEACDEVYFRRIRRGNEAFSWRKLGAFGAELGAIASFFERLWSRATPALTEVNQAWLLSVAAFTLRALGRLTKALEPMRAGLDGLIAQEDWKQAAISASNLSELEVMLGSVSDAVRDAEQSVAYADRSGEDDWQNYIRSRTTLADALHQSGRRPDALALFRRAESLQAARQPGYPLLYSLRCFQYCDLLLADAERAAWQRSLTLLSRAVVEIPDSGESGYISAYRDVEQRTTNTLAWARAARASSLLDIALDHLTLSRASLYRALLSESSIEIRKSEIENLIASAVEGLRRAGTMDHLPPGLLTRAWQRAVCGDLAGARADLDEAWEIAERGPMPLFLADIHLHRARLFGRPASSPLTPTLSPGGERERAVSVGIAPARFGRGASADRNTRLPSPRRRTRRRRSRRTGVMTARTARIAARSAWTAACRASRRFARVALCLPARVGARPGGWHHAACPRGLLFCDQRACRCARQRRHAACRRGATLWNCGFDKRRSTRASRVAIVVPANGFSGR